MEWLKNIDWPGVSRAFASLIGFLGDLVTCILGALTLIAYFKYRKRISSIIRGLRLNHLNDRIVEINETLALIDGVQVVKGGPAELRANFGRLSGQLIPICNLIPALKGLHEQIDEIAISNSSLTEPIKRKIISQIKAEIAKAKFLDVSDAVGSDSDVNQSI